MLALTVEPLEYHGPGWRIDTHTGDDPYAYNGADYYLWAPNQKRGRWAAAWGMNGGHDGSFTYADTPAEALAVFATCPRRKEADAAVQALLDAAHHYETRADPLDPDPQPSPATNPTGGPA